MRPAIGMFIGIGLNLCNSFGYMVIFIVLVLFIQKQGMLFHFLISSSTHFSEHCSFPCKLVQIKDSKMGLGDVKAKPVLPFESNWNTKTSCFLPIIAGALWGKTRLLRIKRMFKATY